MNHSASVARRFEPGCTGLSSSVPPPNPPDGTSSRRGASPDVDFWPRARRSRFTPVGYVKTHQNVRSCQSAARIRMVGSKFMASAVPVDEDEAALVARLRAGDETAYEFVVRTYGRRLLTLARRILGSEEDARDAVQEAFLNAFRSLNRFEGGSRFSTWLHRIAVNAALMKLRTRRRKPEQSLEHLLPSFNEEGHFAERFASWDEPVDKALERAETQQLVRAHIEE